jgi:hypothetical protein
MQQEIEQEEFKDSEIVELPDDNDSGEESIVVVEEETRTNVQDSDEDELSSYSQKVQKRIKKLNDQRRVAQEEADAAVQYAQQIHQENEKMRQRLANLDKAHVTEYEGRVNAQKIQAKRALAEAHEQGDYEKVANAQDAIAKLAIEEERIRNQKVRAAKTKHEQSSAPQQPAAPQRAQPDTKLEAWMDKNPWFGPQGDKIMSATARAIHEVLVGEEGYSPTTDEYYAEIDKRMRKEMPHKFQGDKRVQSVTPASDTSRTVKSGRRKQVELTKGQVSLANKLNIPLEKYAQEVAKLENRRS